jgi:predicted SAM-dependent methyltransferase
MNFWTDNAKPRTVPRKLHIGGQVRTPGWEVLDANPGPCVDHVANASDLRIFQDNSFEQIYASHVVEHFDYRDQLVETLKEWCRVLMPAGTVYVSVPDLDTLARLFVDRSLLSGQDRFLVMRMIFGGHIDKHDYHLVGRLYKYPPGPTIWFVSGHEQPRTEKCAHQLEHDRNQGSLSHLRMPHRSS